MRIEQATDAAIGDLWRTLEPRLETVDFLEQAAQQLVTAIYERFEQSVIIARVFVSVPFADLPMPNQEYVRKLAAAGSEITLDTPVLSLVATRGVEPAWNDRRLSHGHKGIPVISSAFVGAIPMISRLLRELGVPVEWADSHDTEMIVQTIGTTAGVFFVDDAAEATDSEGRKIIPAQDFVADYGVKSVFGTGGAYLTGQMLVLVVFCRDRVSRPTAERFLEVANLFKGKTTSLAYPETVFATER